MTRPPSNIAASVKQRLLNIARSSGEDFNTLLVRYGVERFLYRLSISDHAELMVLKGAMLFVLWRSTPHRPTRDLDLLSFGSPNPDVVARHVRDILAIRADDDGLIFDLESISARNIKEEEKYKGVRVTFKAMLGKAVLDLQVDVGFGDAVLHRGIRVSYPTILDFPAPQLRAYDRETVIAEKLHAMVELGFANSRMKDFYDILILSREFDFSCPMLASAIQATFSRRATDIPSVPPLALTDVFSTDRSKQLQWAAFLRRLAISDAPADLVSVIAELREFLLPPLGIAGNSAANHWRRGGPWR